jgi:hypothetical protein
MLVQVGNVAEQMLARLETLINERLGGKPDAVVPDRELCPHCGAIVPSIRPLPFEYCPYCEASLVTTDCEDRQERHVLNLTPVVESLASTEVGALSSP